MKSLKLSKVVLLLCAPIIFLSCSSWEEVVAPDEFKPLKITSISPTSTAYLGDKLVITGENFIDKKYMQVWFGGNVRGSIDSNNASQIFLSVPKEAKTGRISVSNGIYADTLKNEMKIFTETLYKKVELKFGRFSFKGSSTEDYLNEYGRNSREDSSVYIAIIPTTFTGEGKELLTREQVNPFIGGGCFYYEKQFLNDSSFREFQFVSVSQPYDVNYDSQRVLTMVSATVDSLNKVIPKLTFYRCQSGYSSISGGSKMVSRVNKAELRNVPFLIVNNKIIISLKDTELNNYINFFTDDICEKSNKGGSGGQTYWRNFIAKRSGPHDLMPGAYFELTLE